MGGLDSGQTELAFLACSFRCWWEKDLKLPFSPTPSNKPAQERHLFLQPSPAEGWVFDRAWNSCCLWFSRSLIHQPGWTTSRGCINSPKLLPRSLGPVTGNLSFPLSHQVSRPCTLCSSWWHTQLQHWPAPRYKTGRIIAGESWHPTHQGRHTEPQVCRAQNFPTPGKQNVLTLLIPILQSPEQ